MVGPKEVYPTIYHINVTVLKAAFLNIVYTSHRISLFQYFAAQFHYLTSIFQILFGGSRRISECYVAFYANNDILSNAQSIRESVYQGTGPKFLGYPGWVRRGRGGVPDNAITPFFGG